MNAACFALFATLVCAVRGDSILSEVLKGASQAIAESLGSVWVPEDAAELLKSVQIGQPTVGDFVFVPELKDTKVSKPSVVQNDAPADQPPLTAPTGSFNNSNFIWLYLGETIDFSPLPKVLFEVDAKRPEINAIVHKEDMGEKYDTADDARHRVFSGIYHDPIPDTVTIPAGEFAVTTTVTKYTLFRHMAPLTIPILGSVLVQFEKQVDATGLQAEPEDGKWRFPIANILSYAKDHRLPGALAFTKQDNDGVAFEGRVYLDDITVNDLHCTIPGGKSHNADW